MTKVAKKGLIFLICTVVLGLSSLPAMAAAKKTTAKPAHPSQMLLTIRPMSENGVSDVDLVSTDAVKFEILHQLPINEQSLRVYLRFDGGSRLDVTEYFVRSGDAAFQSAKFHQLARTLFSFMSNTQNHVIQLEVSAKTNGKTIKAACRVAVYPKLPTPPPATLEYASR